MAKKKEIDAQIGVRDEAKATIKEQEEALDLAKEEEKLAKDRAKAQQELVQQLLDLTKIQSDVAGGLGDISDALAGLEIPDLEGGLTGLQETFNETIDKLETKLIFKLAIMGDKWNKFVKDMQTKWEELNLESLKTSLDDIETKWGLLQDKFEGSALERLFKWLVSPEVLATLGKIAGWTIVIGGAITLIFGVLSSLSVLAILIPLVAPLALIGTLIGIIVAGIVTLATKLKEVDWNIFKTNALTAINSVFTKIGELILKIIEFGSKLLGLKLPSWLTPGSPTPLENGLVGISNAIDDLNKISLVNLNKGLNNATSSVPTSRAYGRVTPSTVSNSSTANTFNFGGNNINNGMDAALFEAMVRRSVERIMT